MRVIGRINHPSIGITIFHMNDKYIVKFEAGPMEQLFKFPQAKYPGLESIQALIDEAFIEKVRLRFNEMYQQLIEAEKK